MSLLPILEKLVSIPSQEGNTLAKKEIIDFVSDHLADHGVPTGIIPHPELPALHAQVKGKKPGKLILLAHLDTVPAPDDLFQIKQEGDKIMGRGTNDDKGPATIIMELLKDLAAGDLNHPTLVWIGNTDEEIGSPASGPYFTELAADPDILGVIAIDGGSQNEVVIKQKGVLHLVLRAQGQAAHGSKPWLGDNAVEKLWQTISLIRNIFAQEDHQDPNHWHSTCNIGYMKGGSFINQVADQAECGLDIRFIEGHNEHDLLSQVRSLLPKGVIIHEYKQGTLFANDPTQPLLGDYTRIMSEVYQQPFSLVAEHGSSDGRFFGDRSYPVWMHRPLAGGLHAPEEWVSLNSLEKFQQGLKTFIQQMK